MLFWFFIFILEKENLSFRERNIYVNDKIVNDKIGLKYSLLVFYMEFELLYYDDFYNYFVYSIYNRNF